MIKETKEEFLKHFSITIHQIIIDKFNDPETDGMICFMCQQMDSSRFGHTTAMVYGPNRTYKTVKEVEGHHLYDLPSQREYPISYWSKEEV